jgi:beta-galactosidase/beta-glucuronidase
MPSRAPSPSAGHGYPRPQLRRESWLSLNGSWDFALDPEAQWSHPSEVVFDRKIQVPFAPESPASGVSDTRRTRACWYQTRLRMPALTRGERLWLRFGAVDYQASVWVNGSLAGRHEGGYTPFSVDLSYLVNGKRECIVTVQVEDDPLDLCKPRGKQAWNPDPHSIWYPRTSGIWQTVWAERVPATWIDSLRWTPNLERWELGFEAWIDGLRSEGMRLSVELRAGELLLAHDSYLVVAGEVHRRIALSDPGIDDYRNELLWNPDRPTIINADIRLWSNAGELVDSVQSYTALRAINVDGNRFVFNGRPYALRLVLDQGYWPDTGLTAPDDAALRRDVELAKAMGFNGVRKHQKIEDPRYLYWADHLGLLVWEEMPSAYRFTTRSIERVTREWMAAIARDFSHPCIVAWVPFNESWGVPNLPQNEKERHYVHALYHLTKTLDHTRPVVGNDGWESIATDIIGIHDYESDPERLEERYQTADSLPRLFEQRPAGRALVLEGERHVNQPIMLTEFGGITLSDDHAATWGYWRATSPDNLALRYTRLLQAVHAAGLFAGFCYTQFADTYQEANGLLYADRTPKFPLTTIAAATRGLPVESSPALERSDVQASAPEA